MELNCKDYLISTDKSLLDHETIYRFLASSYWANKRPTEAINKSIETSLCYGVYLGNRQIGFARVVTDFATMYWLADVIIDEEYRGRGIGKKLVETIVASEELKGLNGILGTLDAHGLYEQYGFEKNVNRFMVKRPS
ncbi:GNAT family N-acetyltransferase [Heliobacterium gestii]|uniref:GNAT family N-acetyltransferase n=1 Tax=Heliomicrobium gestii TaxID=2699 RepID=A0A845LA16_HELGE|nr:GNAT family N-acetyltransferase [Heliomicrobium gestii]MBM7865894.1 GNAT superfamily N-acetyltransferase [Heliomicrobium gestii]MZP42134.1 GNAT family N-acetyltransferase [Heliomicrobium gestii]